MKVKFKFLYQVQLKCQILLIVNKIFKEHIFAIIVINFQIIRLLKIINYIYRFILVMKSIFKLLHYLEFKKKEENVTTLKNNNHNNYINNNIIMNLKIEILIEKIMVNYI